MSKSMRRLPAPPEPRARFSCGSARQGFHRAGLFGPAARRPSGPHHQRRESRTPHPTRPHDASRSPLGRV